MPLVWAPTPTSSAIRQIGWDVVTNELRIVFRKNQPYPEYIFGGVGEEMAVGFLRSGSKGTFYHRFIANRSEFKVRPAIGSFRLGAIGRRITKGVRSVVGGRN